MPSERPVVALSMRITRADGFDDPRDSISHDWVRRLESWDMRPVPIPNVVGDPVAYLDYVRPDVLVLTGGDDLGVTPIRDAAEAAMLAHALRTELPVLGVCRGLQVINTQLGGSLAPVDGHVGTPHRVSISEPWRKIYDKKVEVNSFHAFGVTAGGLARDLVATAVDDGAHVEACFHRRKPLAAVMWHPERDKAPDGDRLLMAALIERGAFWT